MNRHIRARNENALAFYNEWGFKSVAGTNADWPDFEYISANFNVLQKAAAMFDRLS